MEKKLYKKPSVEEVKLDDSIISMLDSGNGGSGSGGSSGGGKKPKSGTNKSAGVPEMYSNPFGDDNE